MKTFYSVCFLLGLLVSGCGSTPVQPESPNPPVIQLNPAKPGYALSMALADLSHYQTRSRLHAAIDRQKKVEFTGDEIYLHNLAEDVVPCLVSRQNDVSCRLRGGLSRYGNFSGLALAINRTLTDPKQDGKKTSASRVGKLFGCAIDWLQQAINADEYSHCIGPG